ncbi:hypothetical protein MC5_01510 [Rickettsia australis str. Cutlack]|uniref:Uncharacterized protein n=1 Tax=Rickettsia australis (strain Cutlack) TaxID=1105110 RepID=H8K9I3_RICAC|nr:hypothetical protein MC5_01510 [Rickettsia australis str. Cutlack]
MILSIVTSPVGSIGKSTKELSVICHLTNPPSLAVTLNGKLAALPTYIASCPANDRISTTMPNSRWIILCS